MLLDPEPHIPLSPDVSTIPEDIDSPDVAGIAVEADIPDDVDVPDGATPPIVPAMAAVVVPVAIVIPPPSYVAGDPNVPVGEVARVEQAPAPLLVLGTAIAPVMPLGSGLTGGDTPGTKPLVPTGALGSAPREDVTPRGGTAVPTWANAGPQNDKSQMTATINNGLMAGLHDKGTRLLRRGANTAIGNPAGLMTHIFIAADRGWTLGACALGSRFQRPPRRRRQRSLTLRSQPSR
jgi:hypothetical protein